MSVAKLLTGFDETALVELEQRHRLLPDVKAAYMQMQQAAAADGIELALVSSYRSFAQQARIWTAKYTGQRPVYNKAQQQVDISQLDGFAKIEAILKTRRNLAQNAAPLLLIEALMCELR